MNAKALFVAGLIAGCLSSTPTLAQGRYFWSRTYDGPAQRDDAAIEVALGSHGEVYVAGYSMNATDFDALILAYDAYGHTLWEQRIDLGSNDYAQALRFDPASGALYAAGGSYGSSGAASLALWRLDTQSGAIVWQSLYSGPQQQGALPQTLALDSSGAPLVGGYLGSTSQHDVLVTRFDSTGTLSWSWSAPAPGSSFGYTSSIAAAPNGECVVQTAEWMPGTAHTFHKLDATGMELWAHALGSTDTGCFGPYLDGSSNVVYAINVGAIGGNRIGKLDPAGNLLWSVDAQTWFGVDSSTAGLALDATGEIVAVGSGATLVRLDPNGNALWTASVPATQWFDLGFPAGLALAPNGDSVLRLHGHTPANLLDYDSLARFDAAGSFLWSQSIRGVEPGTQVQTSALVLAPQGSVIIAGYSRAAASTTSDVLIAALHEQSHAFCFGDGSSGTCPCNNDSPSWSASGCRRSGLTIGARLDDQGIASLGSDSLRFFAASVSMNGLGVLLQGQPASGGIPLQDGLLCLTGPLLRMQAATANGFYLDLPLAGGARISARSATLGDPIAPGSSRAYQLYYRGGAGLCAATNGNLTNGVVVDWLP